MAPARAAVVRMWHRRLGHPQAAGQHLAFLPELAGLLLGLVPGLDRLALIEQRRRQFALRMPCDSLSANERDIPPPSFMLKDAPIPLFPAL